MRVRDSVSDVPYQGSRRAAEMLATRIDRQRLVVHHADPRALRGGLQRGLEPRRASMRQVALGSNRHEGDLSGSPSTLDRTRSLVRSISWDNGRRARASATRGGTLASRHVHCQGARRQNELEDESRCAFERSHAPLWALVPRDGRAVRSAVLLSFAHRLSAIESRNASASSRRSSNGSGGMPASNLSAMGVRTTSAAAAPGAGRSTVA